MKSSRITDVFVSIVSIAAIVGWPVLVHDYEVPLLWGTLLWGAIIVVVFWFLLRPMFVRYPVSGWNW